jgi:hypothetical protein
MPGRIHASLPKAHIELERVTIDLRGQPIPSLKINLSGRVRGVSINWTRAGRKRTVSAAAPFVSNWALFDAIQRLKPGADGPIDFTLVDDGDVLKPAQKLTYAGKTEIKVAGVVVLALDCWEQTGYGTLPAHYWVDGKGRLLFAVLGEKALLYDSEAGNKKYFGIQENKA